MLDIEKSKKATNRFMGELLGITESTFRSRRDLQNFTPNDVEKIADFFQRPIAYYFDKEEEGEQITLYTQNHMKKTSGDTTVRVYNCSECISKQKEIDRLTSQLNDKEKIISLLEGRNQKATSG